MASRSQSLRFTASIRHSRLSSQITRNVCPRFVRRIWSNPPSMPQKLSKEISLIDSCEIVQVLCECCLTPQENRTSQWRNVVQWKDGGPRTVLIVCGRRATADTSEAHGLEIAAFLRQRYKDVIVLYDQPTLPLGEGVYTFQDDDIDYLDDVVDLIIAVGGSNTLNRVSQLTPRISAPVLTLYVTTPGLAMSYNAKEIEKWIPLAMKGGFLVTPRMRLKARVLRRDEPISSEFVFMHEINLQRQSNFLTNIDCFVNGIKLTQAKADGLLVATPTGSIGYSLSAGSAIVHPSLQGILLTPVCPRSLSFRPALLPADSLVLFEFPASLSCCIHVPTSVLQVNQASKGNVIVTVDDDVAKKEVKLLPGHKLEVTKAEHSLYTIEFPPRGVNWVYNLQRLLRWRYRKFKTISDRVHEPFTEPETDVQNTFGEQAFLESMKAKKCGGS